MMKSPAALVIGLGKGGKAEDDDEHEDEYTDGGDDDAEADAGQALVDAIASKDGQAVYDAFETLMALCKEG